MVRAYRAALAAGGLLMRAAVAFVGFMVVAGALARRPEPDARARSGPGDPPRPGGTVVLAVPEERLGGSLTVVDGSGRELLTVTHWYNGDTSVLAHRSGGVDVGCHLNGNGSAAVQFTGTAWVTRINAEPDGTAKTSVRSLSEHRQHSVKP